MGLSTDEDRWTAVLRREEKADGQFYYAVRTTGVYCRPSCPSRRPKRSNVSFHTTRDEATRLGFRPCRRCDPDGPSKAEQYGAVVRKACALIDAAEEEPNLDHLARGVGMSPFHFHRVFRAVSGITPKAYVQARRTERVRASLSRRSSVTDAMYDAGFNSSGRFYAKASETLGMKPAVYRTGGKGERIRFAVAQCSLGAILIAATDAGICAITLGDEPEALVHALERQFPLAQLLGGDPAFDAVAAAAIGVVEQPSLASTLPLDIRGTAFQQRVWTALQAISPGTTLTYSEVARRIGVPKSARAVARACASNPVAVAIPCHRVVRTDGTLSGYKWGIERKRALLEREAS